MMRKRKRSLSAIEELEKRLCGACREMMIEVESDNGKPCLFCTKCQCATGGTVSEERKARLGFGIGPRLRATIRNPLTDDEPEKQ